MIASEGIGSSGAYGMRPSSRSVGDSDVGRRGSRNCHGNSTMAPDVSATEGGNRVTKLFNY